MHTCFGVSIALCSALRKGIYPVKLGLAKEGDKAYIQCVDPGKPYTDGGTVIFKCYKLE